MFQKVCSWLKLNFLKFGVLFVTVVSSFLSHSQTYTFAELTGSPTMNTSGWNLTGNAAIGDTPGDADNFSNELVLTTAVGTFQSGAVFWNTPIDLGICSKWTVEFEYRIWGGSAADGLAFCFLDVPPTGFVPGGGVGIPGTSNGLKVILDTYDNCGGPNPELQIYSGVGYDECVAGITKLENVGGNLDFVRSNSYQPVKITYDSGVVELFINNTLYLTANAPANFTGYMGFTSSTGGLNDDHSIRNVVIYTEQAASDAGPDVTTCSGQPVQIGTMDNPLFEYSWVSGTGLNATNISDPTVTVTNTGNVPIYDTLVVETTLLSNPGVCPTNDTVIVIIAPNYQETVSVNHCGTSYQWNGSNYTSSGSYTVNLNSVFGCDSSVTLDLTLNTPPVVSVVGDTICEGEVATVVASGANSYSWNTIPVSTGSSISVTPTISTTYEVIGTTNGCSDTTDVYVHVYSTPTLNLISNSSEICVGDSVNIIATGADSYVWSGNSIQNPVGSSQSLALNQTETISVTGTNIQGCEVTGSITITVNQPPSITISGLVATICEGESITLTANGATNYNWTGAGVTNPVLNPQTLSLTQNSSFEIIGEELGCLDTISFSIDVVPGPELTLVMPEVQCSGEEDTIFVFGADSYDWSPDVNEIQPGVGLASPSSTTIYTITGTDSTGCSTIISGTFSILPYPVAGVYLSNNELDVFVSTTTSFINQSENASSYFWDFGDGTTSTLENPIHTYSDAGAGMYPVTLFAYNDLGCFDSTIIWVQVSEGILYYVPNSFSPDGDEYNQLFKAEFAGGFDPYNFVLSIYNRWGELVFETSDVLHGWDGTYNGFQVSDGAYTWMIRYKEKNNDVSHYLYGHVNLIR